MDSEIINRIKIIKQTEKMLEICFELSQTGILTQIFTLETYQFLKDKIMFFDITPYFNFILWKKLDSCITYFNYVSISKKKDLKFKWMQCVFEVIPEIDTIFNETHYIFDRYKKIMFTLLE